MNTNDLEILLHHYTTTQPSRHPRYGGDAIREATKGFVSNGILQQYPAESPSNSERFTITEKGRCYMKIILNTPIPTVSYINPITNEPIILRKEAHIDHNRYPDL